MKLFRHLLTFLAGAWLIVDSAGATSERTKTFKLYASQNATCSMPFNALCPWPGADGEVVTATTYCGFKFLDPLPAGSIVIQIDTRISMLPSPVYAGMSGSITLNEDASGVDPDAVIGTFLPPTQQTGCPNPPFYPGGLTAFLSVMAPGIRSSNPAGISKYNYRLTPTGTPNLDSSGMPTLNILSYVIDDGYLMTMEFVEITLHYMPPPHIDFEITSSTPDDDRKVLISKQRPEDTYPSTYQRRIQTDRDGKIDIRATIYDANGAPMPGKTVYLRLADPADTSDYAANVAKTGDNTGMAALTDTKVIADSNGEIHTTLIAPLANAGDNYQVQASPVPAFGSSAGCDAQNVCYQSGIITAWKRVYLEIDRMFRVGVNLEVDTPAGSSRVRVASRAGLNVGATIMFIHAPDRSTYAQPFYSEVHVIQQIHGHRHPAIVLDSPLTHDYFVESAEVDAAHDHLADAIGVISSPSAPLSSDLADVRLDYVQPLFKSAFVDYVILDCTSIPVCDQVPYVPHYDSVPYGSVYAGLATKWSFTRAGVNELPNHQHLLSGVATALVNQRLQLGDSSVDGYVLTPPFSWVWADTIKTQANALAVDYMTFLGETAVHEIAHQWDVNPPTGTTEGHCSQQSWDNRGECLMNGTVTADRANGHVAFHDYADSNNEYKRIRRKPDPLPQASAP